MGPTLARAGAATALLALSAILVGCGSEAPGPGASPGARLYAMNCQSCHGAEGQGVRGMQPPLAGTPVPVGDPDVLLGWVMYGQRPAVLPRGAYAGVMPQFSYLTDADLAALLTHVRSSFGNHAAPVLPSQVAAMRSAHPRG